MSLSVIPKSLVLVMSLLVALVSWRFIVLGVEASMAFMLYHAEQRPLMFFAHVDFAPLALLLMPFQFWTGLRLRHPHIHRWIGRLSALAILISALAVWCWHSEPMRGRLPDWVSGCWRLPGWGQPVVASGWPVPAEFPNTGSG